MKIFRSDMKPSDEIKAALEGAVSIDDLEPAILSALRLPVYNIACNVLKLPGNTMQREEIEKHPEAIQALIRLECRRVYDFRHK